jgi:NAD(P)-dependent dehydrogenase (short-subunit alcohol dehydrogenase family)
MAAQHGPSGVRFNAVLPGSVWTPFVERLTASPAQRDELRARRTHTNMLRAEGTGWDVAYAILFLASDESRWITSQALVVDGGQTKQLAD